MTMPPNALGAALALAAILASRPAVAAGPAFAQTESAVVVRGRAYEFRFSRTAGTFDLLVEAGGRLESVMRPGGERGWFGYETNGGGGRSTRVVRPSVSARKHARGVTVTARCVLDAAAGISHTAQYDCLDDCIVVCSRYDGPVPAVGLPLVRTGPKLDVDITRLDHFLFHDAAGGRHAGDLAGRQRVFYAGVRPWGDAAAPADLDPARPYQALYNPQTGAGLVAVYPFQAELWRGQPRFLELYRDGGNYWYTGVGTGSAFGRDYVLCLVPASAPGEPDVDERVPAVLANARDALRRGEIRAMVDRRPGPGDGPLYLLNYDHAVGYPRIQAEARKSASFLDGRPELRVGRQAEGYTWDWLAQNDPAFVAEARSWIGKYAGRWAPGGGSYGQPYFTFISEESGIRQMLYGTRAIREHLGYDNRLYLYSEHETMPQLPQILAGMGYRGAFFRTHMSYGGDGPSRDADRVRWIGPDGSAIPAVPAYTGREHAWGNEWLAINYKPGIEWYRGPACTWDDVNDFKTEMLARGVTAPLISRCEDWYTRPSKPLLDDVRAHAGQRTRWVTAEEYFDVLERSGKRPVDMAVGPNDFQPRQPWGYAGNRTWTGPRAASSQALTAEALASAAILSGFRWTPEHQRRLDDSWKNLLIAEHHDSLICAIYNEGRDFTDPSTRLSADLSREMAGHLTGRVGVRGPAALVFNATGHPRTEAVRLPNGPASSRVLDAAGKPVPMQQDGKDLWFLARDVPPLGYAAFRLEPGTDGPAAASPAGRTLTTDRCVVTFGELGGLAAWRDRATGRDLLKAGGVTGVLKGLIDSAEAQSQGTVSLTLDGPCVWEAREVGAVGAVAYTLTYTFRAGRPGAELHVRLQVPKGTRIGSPADRGTPEARRGGIFFEHALKLRYVLDTALPADAAVVRHQPLIVSTMPAGAETVDANLWAGLEAGDSGVAIANRGSMGLRHVGGSLEPLLAYSGEYVWGDNFLDGVYDYDFALIPYGGQAGRGAAHRAAVEFDRPLYVTAFEGAGGDLPARRSFVDPGRCADAVTALALFPQDGRIFLRLCNMGARPTTAIVPAGHRADLALRLGEPVSGRVKLAPWRAQTYEVGRPAGH